MTIKLSDIVPVTDFIDVHVEQLGDEPVRVQVMTVKQFLRLQTLNVIIGNSELPNETKSVCSIMATVMCSCVDDQGEYLFEFKDTVNDLVKASEQLSSISVALLFHAYSELNVIRENVSLDSKKNN